MQKCSLLLYGRALLTSAGLLLLQFRYLMGQLHIQSIEMHHMDPTDIVLVPFDLHRLGSFMAAVFFSSLVILLATGVTSLSSLPKLIGHHWLQTTCAVWMAAILCGTPPFREVYHTGLACAYFATLVVCTSAIDRRGQEQRSTSAWWQSRLELPLLQAVDADIKEKATNQQSTFDAQLIASCQVHATFFVTIPFQVLRLYDWGSQIQRWPLPIILGSTYGFVLGSFLGCLGSWILQCSPLMADWYRSWTTQSSREKRGTRVNNNNNKHQD